MMAEWRVTPDYVVTHWTEELLNLMLEKLTARYRRIANNTQPTDRKHGLATHDNVVSDKELFGMLGKHIKTRRVTN